jgi:hypothetical protein
MTTRRSARAAPLEQAALFADLRRPSRAARERVNAQRDAAMASVETAAERARRMFAADAGAFVVRYLQVHGPTAAEVLTRQCRAAGIIPHDDRAIGPVYMRLSRAGVIVKVGSVRRERGHGTAGGNIWAIAPPQEAAAS